MFLATFVVSQSEKIAWKYRFRNRKAAQQEKYWK